jgi:hypothetical protein
MNEFQDSDVSAKNRQTSLSFSMTVVFRMSHFYRGEKSTVKQIQQKKKLRRVTYDTKARVCLLVIIKPKKKALKPVKVKPTRRSWLLIVSNYWPLPVNSP